MNKMKIAVFGVMLMFSLSFLIPLSHAQESELGKGWISLVQGEVLLQAKDDEEWMEASVNFPIMDGDRIVTEWGGRVELQFQKGTYVRVGEISQLEVITLGIRQERPFIHLQQSEGRIYVTQRPINGDASSLYIDLPFGMITSYVPSRFKIDLTPSETRISVLDGKLEFKMDGRPISLTQGRTLIIKDEGYAEMAQLYGRDDWDRWNESRDNELLQRQYAQTYLPPELEAYGEEMEGYGRWVFTPEYQYVWVPKVVVGWSPFRSGYWAWRSGIYCWIPHETWGWVPFHYGRWVHIRNHGWVWVPPSRQAVVWNPGAVAWHISPTSVSWVPLAPGEIYYGHRSYGSYSVNINQTNIIIQKNVYINAQVKDAVVTTQKDTFFKRNPIKITKVENPFLKDVKVSAPPKEKPISLGEKKIPARLFKEPFGNLQAEKKPSLKGTEKDFPSVQKSPKMIEEKQVARGPEKKTISETIQNPMGRLGQSNLPINSSQGNTVKKDLPFGLPAEKSKGESKALNPEGDKNKNAQAVPPVPVKTVSANEPKYSQANKEKNVPRSVRQDRSEKIEQSSSYKENIGQRNLISLPPNQGAKGKSPDVGLQNPQKNTSVNINQNRSERTAQTNASSKTTPPVQSFSQNQVGKNLPERSSLPEVKSSMGPAPKGQIIPNSRGSVGGSSESSPFRSFR